MKLYARIRYDTESEPRFYVEVNFYPAVYFEPASEGIDFIKQEFGGQAWEIEKTRRYCFEGITAEFTLQDVLESELLSRVFSSKNVVTLDLRACEGEDWMDCFDFTIDYGIVKMIFNEERGWKMLRSLLEKKYQRELEESKES